MASPELSREKELEIHQRFITSKLYSDVEYKIERLPSLKAREGPYPSIPRDQLCGMHPDYIRRRGKYHYIYDVSAKDTLQINKGSTIKKGSFPRCTFIFDKKGMRRCTRIVKPINKYILEDTSYQPIPKFSAIWRCSQHKNR